MKQNNGSLVREGVSAVKHLITAQIPGRIYRASIQEADERNRERQLKQLRETPRKHDASDIAAYAISDAATAIAVPLATMAYTHELGDVAYMIALLCMGGRVLLYGAAQDMAQLHRTRSNTLEAKVKPEERSGMLEVVPEGEGGDLSYAKVEGDMALMD